MSNGTLKYQKIIRVGNSLAMTIDRDFVTKTGVKAGDQVAVNYDPEGRVASYSPVDISSASRVSEPTAVFEHNASEAKAKMASTITPELEEWTKKFLEENKVAMKKLANL